MERNRFKFSAKFLRLLSEMPETGMGYQVVTITLKDGRTFNQVVIAEGLIKIRGRADIPFTEDDIADITVTHDKCDWSQEDWNDR